MRMLHIAYLISRYPAISHTFILREVTALRASRVAVETASINLPDRAPVDLSSQEREEADRTFYVKGLRAPAILHALCRSLFQHPLGFLRGFLMAVQIGRAHV